MSRHSLFRKSTREREWERGQKERHDRLLNEIIKSRFTVPLSCLMGFCIKCASQQVSAVGPFRQHKTRQGGGPFSRHMSEMTLPGREDSLQSLKCLGVSFWFREHKKTENKTMKL
ncbi:hypothetical protein F2P79_004747 [Pimephales promelas]|nr:hypothetical protein F2P79_004747 [Pimephales promelas]